jgi:hypothetical protein
MVRSNLGKDKAKLSVKNRVAALALVGFSKSVIIEWRSSGRTDLTHVDRGFMPATDLFKLSRQNRRLCARALVPFNLKIPHLFVGFASFMIARNPC